MYFAEETNCAFRRRLLIVTVSDAGF